MGAATCRHLGKRVVLDLGLVYASACADFRVLWPGRDQVDQGGNYHFAVEGTLFLQPRRHVPAAVPPPAPRVRPAAVALTDEQTD